jgi:hypothetical protein
MRFNWMGKWVEDLSREELLECIEWLSTELEVYRKRSADYLKHVDFGSYLMDESRHAAVEPQRSVK